MELNNVEIAAVSEVVNDTMLKDAQLMADLQLAMAGVGKAAVVFG